jgi:hypothetical protein
MSTHDHDTTDPNEHSNHRVTRRAALSALATSAAMLTQTGPSAAEASGEAPELAALDKMASKPTSLTMAPRVTYLGGPTYLIEIGRSASSPTRDLTRRVPGEAKVLATSSPR